MSATVGGSIGWEEILEGLVSELDKVADNFPDIALSALSTGMDE